MTVDRIMTVARGVANGRGVVYDWVVNASMIPDRYYSSPSLNKYLIPDSCKIFKVQLPLRLKILEIITTKNKNCDLINLLYFDLHFF